jgi:hypothetical protein
MNAHASVAVAAAGGRAGTTGGVAKDNRGGASGGGGGAAGRGTAQDRAGQPSPTSSGHASPVRRHDPTKANFKKGGCKKKWNYKKRGKAHGMKTKGKDITAELSKLNFFD